jgi:hypothetical protein
MLDRRTFVATVAMLGCAGRATLAQTVKAHYQGQLTLQPLSDGRLMQLREPFAYLDASGQVWNVPAEAVVDGASIPRVLWSIVGGPWEGRYRDASAIHDWFCAVRIMPWKQTHRMFYEAMLTSNVSAEQARLMFLAVWYAGPTWDDLTLQNSRLLTRNGQVRLDPPGTRKVTSGFSTVEEAEKAKTAFLAEFRSLAGEAKAKDLSTSEIEQLVESRGREEDTAEMLGPQ